MLNDKQIATIKSDPLKYYHALTTSLEKDNLSEEQKMFVEDARLLASQNLPANFEEQNVNLMLSPDQKAKIESNPEKYFKATFKEYKNNPNLTGEQAQFTKAANQYSKLKMMELGKNPEEALETGIGHGVLKTLGNVANVGPNLAAKAYSSATGGPNVNIWGDQGWKQVVSDKLLEDPAKLSAVKKAAYNQPLDEQEKFALRRFNEEATGADIVLSGLVDPTLALDAAVGSAAKLSKLAKVSKPMESLALSKNLAQNLKPYVSNVQDALLIDKVLGTSNKSGKGGQTLLKQMKNLTENVVSEAKNGLNPALSAQDPILNDMLTTLRQVDDRLKLVDKAQTSKLAKAYDAVTTPVENVKKFIGEKTGLRRLFYSDMPGKAADALRMGRIAGDQMSNTGDIVAKKINKITQSIGKTHGVRPEEAGKLLSRAVEAPMDIMDMKLPKPYQDAILDGAKNISKELDESLINQAKAGVRISPLNAPSDRFSKLANEYQVVSKRNPIHPRLTELENEMRKEVGKTREQYFISALQGKKSINYMPHTLSEEAQKFLEQVDSGTIHSSSKGLGHSSTKQRMDELKNLTIDEINEMAANGTLFDNFNGQWFENDPAKLISLYYNRAAKAMTKADLYKGLEPLLKDPELFSPVLAKDFVKIKMDIPGTGDVEVFAHKHIAEALDRLVGVQDKNFIVNKVMKVFDGIQGNWKKITLKFFPSFYIRNMIGNILNNSLAGVVKPKFYTDALLLQAGRPLRFTSSGRIWDSANIMKQAEKYGVVGSGEFVNDIFKPGMFENAQNLVENNARLAHFIGRLQMGDTAEQAANSVRKYLFDYKELTTAEREVFRRVFPFYKWTRENIPLQLENLFSLSSRKQAQLANAINEHNPEGEVVDPTYKSPFLQDMATLSVGRKPGRESLLALEGTAPLFDIMRFIRSANPKDNQFADELAGMVSPLVKIPAEQFFNYDTFQKQKIVKAKGDTSQVMGINVHPRVAHALRSIRPVTTGNKLLSSIMPEGLLPTGNLQQTVPLTKAEAAGVVLFGKPMAYDEKFAKNIASRDESRDIQNELAVLSGDLAKVEKYNGSERPTADIKRLAKWYNDIADQIDQASADGKLDRDRQRVVSFYKSVGDRIKNWAGQWGME